MKYLLLPAIGIILAIFLEDCGGRTWEVDCQDAGVACAPKEPQQPYCCPSGYSCCVRWGTAYGCCRGAVPDSVGF